MLIHGKTLRAKVTVGTYLAKAGESAEGALHCVDQAVYALKPTRTATPPNSSDAALASI
jgi:hypothetical protein